MLLSIRLESHSLGMQVVQAPGNAQGAQAITPVMKDFARNAWHGVAAEAVTSRRLEAIEGADQAHAPLLDEVVTLAIASVELTLRTEVGETQMLGTASCVQEWSAEVLCELRDGDEGWIGCCRI